MTSADQREVTRLVSECLELAAAGAESIPFKEICADRPDLIEEVKHAYSLASGLAEIQVQAPATDRLSGVILGNRYELQSQLGRGAMGVVYRAVDMELGRSVAVKILHTGLLDRTTALARFEREAAALASIKHDAVVGIYDRGFTDDQDPFLVMEWVDGVILSDLLGFAETRDVTDDDASWIGSELGIEGLTETSYLRQSIRWAASLASGLVAAHAAGVFHRDVKPSNIMIRRDGRAVLLDFGIAAQEGGATLTRTDAAVGTPAYMAPEALFGNVKAKATQDVYSLSATLYHMLTLQPPYTGSPSTVLTALATREPLPAFKVRPGLPLDAQAILDHGLARSPGSRYATVDVVQSDLEALLAFQPVSVRPTSSVTRLVRRLRRSKLALGAGLASFLIAGALSAVAIRDYFADQRRQAYEPIHATLPPNLGLVPARYRVLADLELREEVSNVLDRLVETGHDTVVGLTLRCSFRRDHGDQLGALEDMREVDSIVGSAYSGQLLDLMESTEASELVELRRLFDGFAEPEEAWDVYLHNFYTLRFLGNQPVGSLLDDERLSQVRHHQELFEINFSATTTSEFQSAEPDEIYRLSGVLVDRINELEYRFGYQSAQGYHALSAAYFHKDEFGNGLASASEGIRLAPTGYPTFVNAAKSAQALGKIDEAREFVRLGMTACPINDKLAVASIDIETSAGEFERARAIATSHFESNPKRQNFLKRLLASAYIDESMWYLKSDEPRSREAARAATAIVKTMPESYSVRPILLARSIALESGKSAEVFRGALAELLGEPSHIALIANMISVWPEELSTEDEDALLLWCESLIGGLSRPARLQTTTSPSE